MSIPRMDQIALRGVDSPLGRFQLVKAETITENKPVLEKKKKAKKQKRRKGILKYSGQRFHLAVQELADLIHREALVLSSKPTREHYQMVRERFSPFYEALFGKGAQIPVIRLPLLSDSIATTSGTANAQVYGIRFADVINSSSWGKLFDEVRPVVGHLQYDPNLTGGGITNGPTALSVAVIDYNSATALTSFDSGSSFDSKKIYQLAPSIKQDAVWKIQPDWVPDQAWIDTSSTAVLFNWKNYTTAFHGLGNQSFVGTISGWIDWQFRMGRDT
jgi:hypothetical protein